VVFFFGFSSVGDEGSWGRLFRCAAGGGWSLAAADAWWLELELMIVSSEV
jgi:hypothetical protein